ncbi:hypothetical protein [Streptomyces sp. PCS3-D2]|uniref:hypothetical protein n=1 Tax=Streptomyces sp. PCS3-D2 TaxID=1460244 RepID=UPI00351A9DE2
MLTLRGGGLSDGEPALGLTLSEATVKTHAARPGGAITTCGAQVERFCKSKRPDSQGT